MKEWSEERRWLNFLLHKKWFNHRFLAQIGPFVIPGDLQSKVTFRLVEKLEIDVMIENRYICKLVSYIY